MGVAVISAHTVAAELLEGRLVALDIKGLPINRKWYLVKHGHKRFLPSVQALWDFIVANGKHYMPQIASDAHQGDDKHRDRGFSQAARPGQDGETG